MLRDEIETLFRRESGRVLATLIGLLGDFDLAEEAMQSAFETALESWRAETPANPRAWLVGVARNRAIDRIRRDARWREKQKEIERETALDALPAASDDDGSGVRDDMLRLIFTCCHPALSMEAQVALTLRTICGLPAAEAARSFLISEETLAQRLVRAKAKIRDARIPYRVPEKDVLPERLDGVLATIYLVFTEGYAATRGDDLMRPHLCDEAIRLARLVDELLSERPAVQGLLSLMLLHDSRRDARVSKDGDIVRLEDQNRTSWNRAKIVEGVGLLDRALGVRGPPHTYIVQAAIAALHAQAPTFADTDWRQIAGLYAVLVRIQPSPIIELNRAAALSMVEGPARALDLVDALAARHPLETYALLPATRADLLSRLGRIAEARAAFDEAIRLTRLAPERRLLEQRKAILG